MYTPSKILETPETFDFPYEPYDIQLKLMRDLYETLEKKQIGIFESPTGTGKSLTLTCGAIRWLKDHQELVKQELHERINDLQIQTARNGTDSTSDWITEQYEALQQKQTLHDIRSINQKLEQYEHKIEELKKCKTIKLRKATEKVSAEAHDTEPIQQEDENDILDESDDAIDPCNDDDTYQNVKIYFCSRTHTQLAQVVREIKRSAYGESIRCISLASRQQLCINKQVRKLQSVNLINERCLEMARKDSTSSAKEEKENLKRRKLGSTITKCPFKTATMMQELSQIALTNVLDIEDLVSEAESMKTCPYYASRQSIPMAEIVMLPYQMLLHRRTREQNNIQLHGSIVIIDEAHNLLDTLAQIHSCEVSLKQIVECQHQLQAYKMRYANMFSTANLLNINQLLFITKRLIKLLTEYNERNVSTTSTNNRVLRTYELAAEGEFFNIDLNKLIRFCERTHFAQKLQTFAKRMQQNPQPSVNKTPNYAVKYLQELEKLNHITSKPLEACNENQFPKEPTSTEPVCSAPLRPLLQFLETLTEDPDAGRIFITIDTTGDITKTTLKYVLLNPAVQFREIINEARSLVIAGGTMQPTNELIHQLFPSCLERVKEYIYDHVVPQNAVQPFAITQGPTGKKLFFNYIQRSNEENLNEFGMILQNLCNVVPNGVVCFLPSYSYLDTVYAHLQRKNVLTVISKKKKILRETCGSGQPIEKLLAEYADSVKTGNGALLLSVVGGKLSEGLNFCDDLGRGVIVLGLPYPNRTSPELIEKMKHLDLSLGPGAGDEYYENLCMKAVNQCIGRSVRHIRDYACVYLVDERYSLQRIRNKLPQWIARNLLVSSSFGLVQSRTVKFFKAKNLNEF